jgi:antitoxin (DNA-binding transcriptional repressor) of toxin-antitoxin stability system
MGKRSGNRMARFNVLGNMPTYELTYAQEHLAELFHDARSGEEVIIVREDGRSCELTPLAEVRSDEPSTATFAIPLDPEAAGGLVPA